MRESSRLSTDVDKAVLRYQMEVSRLKQERFIVIGELLLRALFETFILILRGGGWLM
jgi:hypothetical protein